MAKGSGGVGKKSGSVSGAKSAVKFGPGDITPANLETAAKSLTGSDRFHSAVFIGPLMAKFGTTPQAAQKQLMALHQDGKITLSRADLVESMNPRVVAASEITHASTGARLHLVRFE